MPLGRVRVVCVCVCVFTIRVCVCVCSGCVVLRMQVPGEKIENLCSSPVQAAWWKFDGFESHGILFSAETKVVERLLQSARYNRIICPRSIWR